ncbi:MAG TPA: response regulator, partial [Nodosilinea sp.]|nr:response regulator [Nodosilinea sp.]
MPSRSLLLIEYEASLRDVLGGCLRELGGWEVTLSESIQEGMKLCEKNRPDVILMDASTPESDALILIEQLKQYSVCQAVPILLISARADWFTLSEFRQMGFSGAIGKPFNPSTLSS